VLDPIERPDRDEAADACWWRLDVERDVLAGRELREAAIGAVADDRPQPSETGQALTQELASGNDIVRAGRARPGGNRQAQDLDE
jgi:hypothetical protein